MLFKIFQQPLGAGILGLSRLMPFRLFIGLSVFILGSLSSVVTAIIAALILVLVTEQLSLSRSSQIRYVILCCFSIGLGAALTPIGETLSTIAINKMEGDFFYLMRLLGGEIMVGLLLFSILASLAVSPPSFSQRGKHKIGLTSSSFEEILVRSVKVYFFVMGLTLLGTGFEPLITAYLLPLDPLALYWINMVSAILDNATLAAAELSPTMNEDTVQAILLGLLISGGMLIPGNIPNIIAAGKLGITSKEWARFGFPVGLAAMLIYFFVLIIF